MRHPPRLLPDPHRRAVAIALPSLLGGAAFGPLAAWAQESRPKLDVPYVPTPQAVVDKMLEMAKVGPNDVLYDLGCGDGRIVITAASRFGARGVGIDIDPERIAEAKENAKKAGVAERVQFRQADLFKSNFAEATVVTLYLLPDINRRLRPQLWRQLKPGTRIVSHAFDMGDEWPPERTDRVDYKTIYAWTIKPEHKKQAG